MIFKLQSNITRVKLFMHHNYFEWAPCIETFGFFAKCVFGVNFIALNFACVDAFKYVNGAQRLHE